MANPNQTWAQDPESGAGTSATPVNEETMPHTADTDRFGKSQTGDTTVIKGPMNRVSNFVWGIQSPSGGKNSPDKPEI